MKLFLISLIAIKTFSFSLSFPINNRPARTPNFHSQDTIRMMSYLHRYGYLESTDNMTDQKMGQALKEFQYFVGISPSGEMDAVTLSMMHRRRCGMPDRRSKQARAKRYSYLGPEIWKEKNLRYRFHNYTNSLSVAVIHEEFEKAIKLWSNIVDITIIPAEDNSKAQMNLYFNKLDGLGNIYGIGFSPPNGTIVFDEDEIWTSDNSDGVRLLYVAAHEMGHTLGLDHSEVQQALMYPYYDENLESAALHKDDIRGVRSKYFRRRTKASKYNDFSNPLCSTNFKIDAAFCSPDGYVFFIRGNQFWKLTSNFQILEGPKSIGDRWPQLPEKLDSVATLTNNVTYFFNHKYMWKYDHNGMAKKSKLISAGLEGIPDNFTASFVWSGNGNFYFFKGDQYWRFDPYKPVGMRVQEKYPQPISNWNGLPGDLDAAANVEFVSYFFKGDKYYKYNDLVGKIEEGYPKNTVTDLLQCRST